MTSRSEPPASRNGTSKASRSAATSASAIRVKRAADDPQGLEHGGVAEQLPAGGEEAQDLDLVRGEGGLVVVAHGHADGQPDPTGLLRGQPGLGRGLRPG